MKYAYLLIAGLLASIVHVYLVWHHRSNRKYSISEHAILDKPSYVLYFATHIFCEVFVVMYAYQFFRVENSLSLAFNLLVVFAVLDFIQAAMPSHKKTEKIHFAAAYISWVCYLAAGIDALIQLNISTPYEIIATILFVPILGMFIYMHFNRSKLYPYQLLMVPLYTIAMLFITLGTS